MTSEFVQRQCDGYHPQLPSIDDLNDRQILAVAARISNDRKVVVSGQAAFMAYRWKAAFHSGDEPTAANEGWKMLPE